MVGNEVARIDWSIEPRNTGSIMLTTMSRLSLWVSGAAATGLGSVLNKDSSAA
jgi:hypothetical protein